MDLTWRESELKPKVNHSRRQRLAESHCRYRKQLIAPVVLLAPGVTRQGVGALHDPTASRRDQRLHAGQRFLCDSQLPMTPLAQSHITIVFLVLSLVGLLLH